MERYARPLPIVSLYSPHSFFRTCTSGVKQTRMCKSGLPLDVCDVTDCTNKVCNCTVMESQICTSSLVEGRGLICRLSWQTIVSNDYNKNSLNAFNALKSYLRRYFRKPSGGRTSAWLSAFVREEYSSQEVIGLILLFKFSIVVTEN